MAHNQWSGIGRLTKDPEMKYSKTGTAMTNITLAVDTSYTKDGNRVDSALFLPCTFYRGTAEAMAKFGVKGKPFFVSGELTQWKSNEGNTVTSLTNCRFEFLPKDNTEPLPAAGEDGPGERDDDEPPF